MCVHVFVWERSEIHKMFEGRFLKERVDLKHLSVKVSKILKRILNIRLRVDWTQLTHNCDERRGLVNKIKDLWIL
jgi:hypothetical protein